MEKKINNAASWIFIIIGFITPLAFSYSPLVAFPFAKILPVFLATFVVLTLFIVHIFNKGRITLPTSWLFGTVALVPLVYIISSFTSVNPATSFMGNGTELGTASFVTLLFLFMGLLSYFMRAKDTAFNACLAFVIAYVILAIFHIPRFIFGADFLSFGIFGSVISNTVGRFNDLGLISGIVVILSLISIEFLRLSKVVRILGYVVLSLALVMLCFTNFPLFIWGASALQSLSLFTFVGFFALTFFVYFISLSYGKEEPRRVPIASLIVLVISVIFTFGAAPLQSVISSTFHIDSGIETRLLWKPTADLAHSTVSNLSVRPFLGYGPEQFAYKWMLDKPIDINNTLIWNAPFTQGSGFIPSTPVTVGLVGFLAWIAFLFFLARSGAQSLFAKIKDPFSNYITTSTFIVSLYLWIAAIVYVPSITTFILTFFFTGLFLASLFREKIIAEKEFIFDNSKGKSFVYIMSLISILLVAIFWGYKVGESVAAGVYAGRANVMLSTAQNKEDIEKVKAYLRSAGSLASEETYSRILANIALAQVNSVVQDSKLPQDEAKQRFQALYPEAIGYAQNAISKNPNSFENYVIYGNVLEVGASLRIEGYAEAARTVYEQARKLNPRSPLIPYLLARIETDSQNIDGAKTKIGEALQLKPNYLEAIIYLGRLQIGEGKKADALNSFIVAQSLDPSNTDIQAVINALRNDDISNPRPVSTATSTATSTPKK